MRACVTCGGQVRASDWDEIARLERAANNAVDAAAKEEEKLSVAALKKQKQLS